MGGFTGLAVDVAEKGLEKLGQSAAAKEMTEFAGKNFSLETALRGKSGDFIRSLLADHKDGTNKLVGQVQQNLAQHFPGVAAKDVTTNMIKAKASSLAEPAAYGKNKEMLVSGIHQYRQEFSDIHARNLADQLGVHLKEQSYPITTMDYGKAQTSPLAHRLSTHPLTKYKLSRGLPDEEKKVMDWGISPYKAPTKAEGIAGKILTTPLMQRVGILHAVGGKMNLMLDSNLKSTMRVIGSHFTDDRAGWIAQAQSIGALSEYNLEKHQQWAAFENRKIPLPDTPFWRAARGNFQSLGLSFAKKNNIIDFGMQGEFEAKYLAKDLFDAHTSGNLSKLERTKYWLKVYGLDGDRILSQGNLTNDDIATAIDRNIERKLMTDTKNLRWIHAQATPMGRITRTFNGYGTGQRNFLLQALKHSIYDVKGGNPMALLTFMGTVGLAYPDVGAAMRYGTDLWTGKDEAESREKMLHTWETTFSPSGYNSGKALMDRWDAAMHFTAVGMLLSHNRYFNRTRILEDILGPAISNVAEQTADVASAFQSKFDETSRKQLMRDVLHDIPAPIIGQYLSGKLLPPGKAKSRKPAGGKGSSGYEGTRGF